MNVCVSVLARVSFLPNFHPFPFCYLVPENFLSFLALPENDEWLKWLFCNRLTFLWSIESRYFSILLFFYIYITASHSHSRKAKARHHPSQQCINFRFLPPSSCWLKMRKKGRRGGRKSNQSILNQLIREIWTLSCRFFPSWRKWMSFFHLLLLLLQSHSLPYAMGVGMCHRPPA